MKAFKIHILGQMHIYANEAGHFQGFWSVKNAATTKVWDKENTLLYTLSLSSSWRNPTLSPKKWELLGMGKNDEVILICIHKHHQWF